MTRPTRENDIETMYLSAKAELEELKAKAYRWYHVAGGLILGFIGGLIVSGAF